MKYIVYSHRHADVVVTKPGIKDDYNDITDFVNSISDADIISRFELMVKNGWTGKSISYALNDVFREGFKKRGWHLESPIFTDKDYTKKRETSWRLDFARNDISIEVGFNHGGSVAWNLIKPVLASELNHVQKAIQTKVGVVITATAETKKLGGFDTVIGSYEKYIKYLKIMHHILIVPIVVIGLKPPETFYIRQEKQKNGRYQGFVEYH